MISLRHGQISNVSVYAITPDPLHALDSRGARELTKRSGEMPLSRSPLPDPNATPDSSPVLGLVIIEP